jgi:hypothetical protein
MQSRITPMLHYTDAAAPLHLDCGLPSSGHRALRRIARPSAQPGNRRCGRPQRFCSERCRRTSEKAMREWAQGELAAGRVTIAEIKRERSSESAASTPSAPQPVPTLRGGAAPLRPCSPRHLRRRSVHSEIRRHPRAA